MLLASLLNCRVTQVAQHMQHQQHIALCIWLLESMAAAMSNCCWALGLQIPSLSYDG